MNAIDSQALTKADTLARIVGSEEFLAQQGSAAEFVARLYEIFLMRDPNSEELDAWRDAIDDGMALSNVVNGFTTSPEFKALVGVANHG